MKVGVIGLGYVGLPLVVAFAEAGDDVVALDVDPLKISAVSAGDSYIEDISSERLRFPRCTTVAQVVLSPLQWKKTRHSADAAICLAPCLTGVLRCSSSRPSWAVADS